MARTKSLKTAARTETVTVDAIDELVAKLNEIEGIEFVRDAWLNKAPDNYGVVELQGEASQLWADNRLIDSIWRVLVTAYVKGDDDSIAYTVQGKLEALEAAGKVDLTHTISREYAFDIGKTCWRWTLNLYGSLTRTEEVPVTEPVTGNG